MLFNLENTAKKLLSTADIKINGNRAWDIQVHNKKTYRKILTKGSLGLGESYMDSWWDCKNLDQFFEKFLKVKIDKKIVTLRTLSTKLKVLLINKQTKRRSKHVAKSHYDIGNELYAAMLGNTMQYTCAYWKNAKTLNQAQENKLDLVCRKLKLKPGMEVLELGGGFGNLARWMGKKYKCKVTSYNISEEQVKYARSTCKGLPVEIIKADYREARGTYDRVASIGLMEHVGYKNYKNFFKLASLHLKKDGLFIVHTIGKTKPNPYIDPWISKYIFPGGMIPALRQVIKASEPYFTTEDIHNFGADYDKTLMAWFHNFDKHWDKLKQNYNEQFYRMWKYYLLGSAGAFRARKLQLWQLVLSKKLPGGYTSVR